MRATEAKFLEFLKRSPQLIIPIYQRTYSWTERECKQLWDDILRTGANDAISAHFVGSIVYIEKGLYHVIDPSPLLVIDGQQRLTTISLILEALARNIGDEEPLDGFSARKLRNYYLLNPEESDERAFKLLLTQTDKSSLLALMQGKPWPSEVSIRIKSNFEYFDQLIKSLGDELADLCTGLAKLVIVNISLSRDQDNPQLIFESMNSTGRELTQADLIRNFILMGLEPRRQERLYGDYWRPMEIEFGQEANGAHFDSFMRHYLTLKTGDIPNVRHVYDAFKNYARSSHIAAEGVDALVQDVHTYAGYYCAMALGKEPDKTLSLVFQDLREFRVDVSYPFLLELYHDYRQGTLSQADFESILRLVEAYVFRRAVCSIPTNSLNKTFPIITKSANKEHYLESIQAYFARLPSYRRFPGDDEFRREIKVRDLYNFPRRSYWLRRMENHDRKERVPVTEFTVEHIMPQNENLSRHWRTELGPEWERVHEAWLHTLGNLTLTGYNPEYSDRPFNEKRDMEGGFRDSPLKLNRGLGKVSEWNEEAIKVRADKLSDLALEVWPAPKLTPEQLELYTPRKEGRSGYSINDHSYLATGSPMRPLFDVFRKEVLTLDPVISEEFLKLYVAYKAETNFVDVVPQLRQLRLSLNMPFHEIDDPKGICRDVSSLGRWGNGDVEVSLTSTEELPYVMGLVRQSFERQMGNGEDLE